MWLKRLGAIALIIVSCSLIFTSIYIFQLKNEKLIFISNDYQKGLGDRNLVARLKKTFKAAGVKVLDLSTFRLISIFFSKNDTVKFFTIIQNDSCNARILDNPIQGVTYVGFIHNPIIPDGYQNYDLEKKCTYYGNLLKKYDKVFDYLLVTSPDELDMNCAKHTSFKQLISWYPTLEIMEDDSKPINNKLFYSLGALWDATRENDKYLEFTRIIAKLNIADIYGKKLFGATNIKLADVLGDAYKGRIKGDNYEFLKVNKEYMGSIINHSDLHLKSGIPSGKIFEATSIKRGVISDKHPWIMKHFGDTIFYVDMVNLSGKEIAKQIEDYHAWMLSNPKEFQIMMDNAYEIFASKFSLNQQINKLIKILNS